MEYLQSEDTFLCVSLEEGIGADKKANAKGREKKLITTVFSQPICLSQVICLGSLHREGTVHVQHQREMMKLPVALA